MGAVAEWMLERANAAWPESIPHGVLPPPLSGI